MYYLLLICDLLFVQTAHWIGLSAHASRSCALYMRWAEAEPVFTLFNLRFFIILQRL